MINQQLLDYIKQQLQQDIDREKINNSLLANGWQTSDIKEAFDSIMPSNQSVQPTPLTSSAPQSFSTLSPQPQNGMSKILLATILIVGVFVFGGGAFTYFNYFQSPDKIVQKMIAKLTEIKSLEYSGEIKTEVNAGDLLGGGNLLQPAQPVLNNKTSNFSINFSGVSDTNDLNNPKGSFSFNINTDALGQENFTLGLEIRTIDKIVYAKLSNLPNLGFFDLTAVSNQWIKIDTEALKKQFGLEKIEEQLEELQKKQELSPEQIEKLKTAVQQHKVFRITENFASEKIEGVYTYHYKFTIDKEEIGKKDFLPYKISLSSVIKETEKSKTSGKVSFALLFKNFNKPVQIEIPTPVKTLEEILGGLFGGMSGGELQRLQQPTFPTLPTNR